MFTIIIRNLREGGIDREIERGKQERDRQIVRERVIVYNRVLLTVLINCPSNNDCNNSLAGTTSLNGLDILITNSDGHFNNSVCN